MNWLEVSEGFTINLDRVQGFQRAGDFATTVYFRMGENLEAVECDIPYSTLKAILEIRTNHKEVEEETQTDVLRRILHGQTTPVP
jgi:hypothetical protein